MSPFSWIVLAVSGLAFGAFCACALLSMIKDGIPRGLGFVFLSTAPAMCVSTLLSFCTVQSRAELQRVELGWPVRIMQQNQERLEPPFPYRARWIWDASSNDMNYPHSLLFYKNLPFSAAIHYMAILALLASGAAAIRRARNRTGTC